jgi:hypothetical protein
MQSSPARPRERLTKWGPALIRSRAVPRLTPLAFVAFVAFLTSLASLVALACGGETTTPPTLAPTESTFAASVAHALCDNLAGCCQANGFSFTSSDCLTEAETETQNGVIAQASAAGIAFDPDGASACLAAIAAAAQSCHDSFDPNQATLPAPLVPGCSNVFSGTVALGQPCANTFSCAPAPSGSVVSCFAGLPEDGGTSMSQCAITQVTGTQGSVCIGSSATPNAAFTQCGPGLFCAGTCQPLLAVGAICQGDEQCVAGAWCSSGLCAPQLPQGAACDYPHLACSSGLVCSGAPPTCVPLSAPGTACDGSSLPSQCAGQCVDLKCSSSQLVSPYCGPQTHQAG